jgi:hypothetical protein
VTLRYLVVTQKPFDAAYAQLAMNFWNILSPEFIQKYTIVFAPHSAHSGQHKFDIKDRSPYHPGNVQGRWHSDSGTRASAMDRLDLSGREYRHNFE